ncbi:DUF2584 family protein [Ectobacillus polymachus]|uniref:DUF2584 family protein n=1 Tax=Ectobacillus polymachus TaxID=1508806 RepID=UPI003A868EE6
MKFETHTTIVTNDNEIRIDIENNLFELTLEGYHMYTLGEPVALFKSEKERIGTAIPNKVSWYDEKTVLHYQLVSLHSVN